MFFRGWPKWPSGGCVQILPGWGGGFPMVKMKSKNALPPILGSENTNLIVVPPNFDPIYHSLTPPGCRARATKTRLYRPPRRNQTSPRDRATWGGLTLAKRSWVGGYSPKNGGPKHTTTCPKSPTCTLNTPWK